MSDKKSEEAPNALPVGAVCVAHGLFLAACGYHGAASHAFSPQAMHSLYSGAGGGAVLVVCGLMSVSGSRKMYMIGVHLALLLQLAFTCVFTLQGYKSYGVPEKADRFQLFCLMGLGSVAALVAMRAFKPKKAKKP